MSYSFPFAGEADEISKTFNQERDKCASYGMIEAEQADIDEARDFAMQFANSYGRISGSVSGHWSIYPSDDPRKSQFGRISVTIDAAQDCDRQHDAPMCGPNCMSVSRTDDQGQVRSPATPNTERKEQ